MPAGAVVRKSVSALSKYRKSAYLLRCGNAGVIRQNVKSGGPAGIRTQDQGIRVIPPFPAGADYLFTRGMPAASGAGRSRLSSRALEALR
jgi:hypothetical protein